MRISGPGNWKKGHQGFLKTTNDATAPTPAATPQQDHAEEDAADKPLDDIYSRFQNTHTRALACSNRRDGTARIRYTPNQ